MKMNKELSVFLSLWWIISVVAIDEEPSLLLPRNILPSKYTLTIFTNLDPNELNFSGIVIIDVLCKVNTDKILLHAIDLLIRDKEVSVTQFLSDNQETVVGVKSHGYENKNDFYYIIPEQTLISSKTYRISINFKGVLNANLYGYYKTSYIERETGETKWLAVTKFSPSRARLGFPCMDEPELKATFKIYMGHAPNVKAISNMGIKDTDSLNYDDKENWIMDEFHETVRMSTYLVAFALADYEHRNMKVEGIDKMVGIWIRKELQDQIELATKTITGALEFYTTYFGVEYALPKLDLVAVPQQENTAVENYGMITMIESALTYDPESSNVMDEYGTAQLICRETCKQWLGNYVTMKWWNDLFLKEGFASYFEDICVAHIFPEWNSLDQMIFRKYLLALESDGTLSSHPIIIPVTNPTDVNQFFDSITYDKAAIVIRMMRIFLTENVFKMALKNYLNSFQYGVATADDLWMKMSAAATVNIPVKFSSVKSIMSLWTLQEGYPYIFVVVDYSSGFVTLTQKRYLLEELSEDTEPSKHCWNIPISFTTSKEPNVSSITPEYLLTCDNPLVMSVIIEKEDWILINIQVGGFFITNFENNNWIALKNTLTDKDSFNKIDVLDRAQILSNCFGISWTGRLPYNMTFGIVKYLENETEYVPWRTALESLRGIRDLLLRTDIIQNFENFVKQFLEPKFSSIDLGGIPSDFMSYRFYTLFIYWACIYGVESCHNQSIEIFKMWLEDPKPDENNKIPPNLRDIVYCEAMKTGGEEIFNFMWDRYSNSNVPAEKSTILTAIGCSGEENLLQKYLEWSLDSERISKPQSTLVYWTVATRKTGFNVAKNFLLKGFANILKYHGQGNQSLGEYLKILAGMMTSKEELKEFEDFLNSAKSQLNGNEVSADSAVSSIKQNLVWMEKHFNELKALLTSSV